MTTQTPDEKREKCRTDGFQAIIIKNVSTVENDEETVLFDYVVEMDYSYLCNNEDERTVTEYRKHAVEGVRWL